MKIFFSTPKQTTNYLAFITDINIIFSNGCTICLFCFEGKDYWYEEAKRILKKKLRYFGDEIPSKYARNVILLVGDGMGLSTLTAARIFKGQRTGDTGEEHHLAWDDFPAIALAKVS